MAMDDDLDPRSLVNKPPAPTKVGDTIYRFDINNRVYRDQSAFGGGGPIYAKHFVPHRIIGEASQSWVLEVGGYRPSIGKAVLAKPGPGKAWFTEAQMADDVWQHDHRYPIIELVRAADVETLRAIARLLHYAPKE